MIEVLAKTSREIFGVVVDLSTQYLSKKHFPGSAFPNNFLRMAKKIKTNISTIVLYLQPLIPPKRFDICSPLTGGCSEGLGAF